MINGSTTICGLLGYPVAHSFSPQMHNTAFETLVMNWVYLPLAVAPQDLPAAVSAITAFNMAGVNVTVPHKEAVLPLLDELTTAAKTIGAVNVIVNQAGKLTGHNTDGAGFIKALHREVAFNAVGKGVVILGAGGAAKAVAVQLALSGMKSLTIINRTIAKAEDIANRVKGVGGVAQALTWDESVLKQVITEADLVVQATNIGMHPDTDQCLPVNTSHFRQGQVVCDLVYNPVNTVFLQRAAKAGAQTVNGLGMLLYQGVLAFELWTGRSAPVKVMQQVLNRAMEGKKC